MNIVPSKKMSLFQPAIFSDLKKYAKQQQEKGLELIDLSLGSPDIPPHEMLRNHMSELSKLPLHTGIH